ncbi:unnamed protein product [Colias eurytheme]|nr:unnamed protein product [Colias eurytheme]
MGAFARVARSHTAAVAMRSLSVSTWYHDSRNSSARCMNGARCTVGALSRYTVQGNADTAMMTRLLFLMTPGATCVLYKRLGLWELHLLN